MITIDWNLIQYSHTYRLKLNYTQKNTGKTNIGANIKYLPLLNEQKYTMSPHPSSLGGCNLSSASRRARVRPLSGATYFKPQASGYWAWSVDNNRVPSFSSGRSTISLSLSFVSDTWTNDMTVTQRKVC